MRKKMWIGIAAAFVAMAAGWGWFMVCHPHSTQAVVAGWWHGAGVGRFDAGNGSSETGLAQSVVELDPVSVAEKFPLNEQNEPVEVIDLTELQRIPQSPVETVEPPLANVVPAVFQETPAPNSSNVKPTSHEETSEPTPPELSKLPIPADFLLHSADGRPPVLDLLSSMAVRLHRQLHGNGSDRERVDRPSKMPATGYDHTYHQQHPGCPYLAGSSFDRVPELLPEPTLLPEIGATGKATPKNSKRGTLEIVPGEIPSFWMMMPY
jgi:hypothetical protein